MQDASRRPQVAPLAPSAGVEARAFSVAVARILSRRRVGYSTAGPGGRARGRLISVSTSVEGGCRKLHVRLSPHWSAPATFAPVVERGILLRKASDY